MSLKRKHNSGVLTDEESSSESEVSEERSEKITRSFFKRKNVWILKSRSCYEFLQKLFDEMTLSQPYTTNGNNFTLQNIFIQQLGKALLFNSDLEDPNRLICYEYPVNIIRDYGLNDSEDFQILELFFNSFSYRYHRPDYVRVKRKFRKPSKIAVDINKNYFSHAAYIWIRDKFDIDTAVYLTHNKTRSPFLPVAIQQNYHASFILSKKSMYEDAVLCFLGLPLVRKEFCQTKKLKIGHYSRIENFLYLCSKIIPDIFNFMIYCFMKNHFNEDRRNIFISHMLNFCKNLSSYGHMERDVLISCIFSVLAYDLQFRPETIYDEYRKIEIKDVYRDRNFMLKYDAFLNVSLFLKWRNEEGDSDQLPVYLFEQLKEIVNDGDILEFMPIFEIFIYLICKYDLVSEHLDLILNAVKNYPTVTLRVAKRFCQENQPQIAKLIERSLDPFSDLHSSHESWIKYLKYKSTQLDDNTGTEVLLQDIKIIVRLLDYGKWRKKYRIWKLFDKFLFVKINKDPLLLEKFKVFFGERQKWWFNFHSIKVSSKTEVIRTKILNCIRELFIC
uniref:ELYS domain-containing protein n=1 Tax=Strongyloides venezuelensis TaxID=75913 RepID=A0A0K0FM77_STRVS